MLGSSPQGAPLDRYVVLEYLSEGGMGAIYIGKKLGAGGFEKEVVLKQLLPEFISQPEFIDLFLREARLSATLDHANIIHTIDLVNAGDEHFIVMEYLPGADLRTLLKKTKRRRRGLSPAAGIYITREVLSALAYAHAKLGPDGRPLRLIHRDVSPSNILISRNGEVKLTDFGIAKASTHNSVFYRVKGKIGYMSPEQARSEEMDHRSDLYSLAVCLYEMITGERLFVHAGLTTSAEEMYSQPIPLVSRKVAGVPPEFDKVLLKALALDPAHRYQSAGEFQEALSRCAHRAGLMMSAPELAAHLLDVCGEPEDWRNIDSETGEPSQTQGLEGEGGTEIYEESGESTRQLDGSDLELDEPVSGRENTLAPVVREHERRRQRARTSITNLGRLRGMALTSMVAAIADVEARGAEPLVDLDALGSTPLLEGGSEIVNQNLSRDVPSLDEALEAMEVESAQVVALPVESENEQRQHSWGILALIVLLGVAAAVAIGLSGPRIEKSGAPGGLPAAETASPDAGPAAGPLPDRTLPQ